VYLSHTGYEDANAYVWQTAPDLLQGQSVNVAIGGGSAGAGPPATDLDSDGFIGWGDIGVMNEYWLGDPNTDPNVKGDLNSDDIVNFLDFAEFGPPW